MNRIRELRQERAWRQEDLAQRMNTKRQTIARYETGVLGISADTVCQLCDIFDCTADYLLCRSDIRDPYLADRDFELLSLYRQAEPNVKAAIQLLLEPYMEKRTENVS